MKKDLKNIVFGVLIALCIFALAMQWLAFIFNFATLPAAMEYSSSQTYLKTLDIIRWACLSIFCLLVPTILCFVLSCFTKSKALDIAAVALGAIIVAFCITFMAVLSDYDSYGTLTMPAVSAFVEGLISIMIPSAILTGFAVARLVKGGKN